MIHILIGDGIPTNLVAAKLLWASVAQVPLGPRVRYFLVAVKCATHQAAVAGTFAAAAGGELYKTIAGVAVKLATLCRAWFPSSWCQNVLNFLYEHEEPCVETWLLWRLPVENIIICHLLLQ